MKCFVQLLCLGVVCHAVEWTYDRCSDKGPSNWPNTCPPSIQTQGSPINLCGAQPLDNAPTFTLANWDVNRTMAIFDNRHTVEVSVLDNPPITLLGNISNIVGRSSGNDTVTWVLKQMHLHWGRDGMNDEGSEHYIEGKRFPLEAHFVHYNPAAGTSPDSAVSSNRTDAILVIGVAFMLGSEDNEVLSTISNDIENLTLTEKDMSSHVNLAKIFNGTGAYYTYAGSLTTPPCAEQVTWVMLQTPLSVLSTTLEKIKDATATPAQRKFATLDVGDIDQYGNFRPLQSRNNRTIYLSNGSSSTCPTAMTQPTFNCTVNITNTSDTKNISTSNTTSNSGTPDSAVGRPSLLSLGAAIVLPLLATALFG